MFFATTIYSASYHAKTGSEDITCTLELMRSSDMFEKLGGKSLDKYPGHTIEIKNVLDNCIAINVEIKNKSNQTLILDEEYFFKNYLASKNYILHSQTRALHRIKEDAMKKIKSVLFS